MANIIRGESFRWPGGVIPYVIDGGDFPDGTNRRAKIQWAIDHWNSRSRLKFVPRESPLILNWVRFVSHRDACRSDVGRQTSLIPTFGQDIRCQLTAGGFVRGAVLHEMCHAVGLFHEHQRPDRDDYVTVMGGDDVNYGRKDPDDVLLLTPYDYLSIMHYPMTPNLVAPARYTIGQRLRLGYLDLMAIEQAHGLGRGDYWLLSSHSQAP
jgi:Astacin (Peptidase family M12A)